MIKICRNCNKEFEFNNIGFKDFCNRSCSASFTWRDKNSLINKERRRKIGESNKISLKGIISWNKGLPMREVSKLKLSNTLKKLYLDGEISVWNKGKKGLYSKKYIRKLSLAKRGRVAWNRGKRTKNHTEETKIKMSQAHKRLFQNPEYVKSREHTFGNGKNHIVGYFKSYKNNCEIYFQSSYELYAYIKLEHDDNVKQYGRCYFGIPYIHNGKMKRYFPDLGIEYFNNEKVLLEIKPLAMLNLPEIMIKKDAGEQYCRENNMSYIIWTEKDIFVLSQSHAVR